MVSSTTATSFRRPVVRVLALALVISSAMLCAASGCGIISEETDCQNACDTLNTCGQLSGGACGAYCASTIVAVGEAGCTTQFEAQNDCVTTNVTGTTCPKVSACTTDITAFTKCLATYCTKNKGAQGCPG
jgi:hypothetical protein